MRALISTLLVATTAATAFAQAQPQPQPAPQPQPQPYPAPQPQPQPYPTPAPQPYPQQPIGPQYGYGQQPVMQYQLTLDDQELLERGYISDGQHIGGGIAALFLGWGLGHAIQGRWSEKGYIFTLGEGASFVAVIWGMSQFLEDCFESDTTCEEGRGFGLMMAGVAGMLVFRTWETIDAFVGPSSHNRKLRALHMRLGMPVPMYARLAPYVTTPRGDTGGAIAGLTLRF